MRFLALLFILLSTTAFAEPPQIKYQASPAAIFVGEATQLRWNIKAGSKAYISNIGRVALSGTQTVSPEKTTEYTLIEEGSSGIAAKTIIVEVKGARGKDAFPDPDKFGFKYNYKLSATSFPEALNQIHNLMQDGLKFTLDEYYDWHEGQAIFITMLSKKAGLVQPGEKRAAARRIAYMIKVKKPSSGSDELSFSIDAYIEYRRRSEKRWLREENEALAIKKIRQLHELIIRAFNS